eukprot:m.63008 g.63008  ORF g.63008 m.63008 type:complete len:337 (+) comp12444_c0_seq3:3-1013(+)
MSKIPVHVVAGAATVFSTADAKRLRVQHRICGTTIGCLPIQPLQNVALGMPLVLMPEEVTLLLGLDVIELLEYQEPRKLEPEEVAAITEKREQLIQTQVDAMCEQHRQKLTVFRQERDAAKKDKRARLRALAPGPDASTEQLAAAVAGDGVEGGSGANTDTGGEGEARAQSAQGETVSVRRGGVSEEEDEQPHKLKRVEDPVESSIAGRLDEFRSLASVSIAQEGTCLPGRPVAWLYPTTEAELLRFRVYEHLWHQGYFVTTATKFGGDFLVYPGDPHRFHSHYVAVIVPWSHMLSPLQLITLGRLGTVVKKSPLLCSVDETGHVRTLSLEWTGAN